MTQHIVNHGVGLPPEDAPDIRLRPGRAALVIAGLLLLVLLGGAVEAADVQVVTHPTNTINEVSRKDIRRIFLRQRSRWGNGDYAKPIDQKSGSQAREDFNAQVLERTSKEVTSYWNSQVFAGKSTPPPTAGSDQEVLDYVRDNPGAVGYVSAGTSTPGVKVLKITDQ